MSHISYMWGVLGDENVPMKVDVEDIIMNPRLICDVAEFEADMNQSTLNEAEDEKPF